MPKQALRPADYPFSDYGRLTFSLGIVAGGSAWLSGSTAARFDEGAGRMVVEGDLVAQTRVVLEKTRITLAAGGLGLGEIVRMVQYVTPAALADMSRLAMLYGEVFSGSMPVVSTIVVKSLLRSAALIEIEAVAGRGAGGALEYLPAASGVDLAAARVRATEALRARGLAWGDVTRTTELLTPAAATSAGVVQGGSGAALRIVMPRVLEANAGAQIDLIVSRVRDKRVLFLTAEGDPAAGGVAEQCRGIYARIGKLLAEGGSGLDAVVKTTEFVTPAALAAYRQTADVRREVFAAPYPAATGVICERLVQSDAQIAVEVVAVREAG